MSRWKSVFLHHWRAKLLSLVVATLAWLALRHSISPPPAEAASSIRPAPPQFP